AARGAADLLLPQHDRAGGLPGGDLGHLCRTAEEDGKGQAMNRWLLCNIILTLAAFAASLYLGVLRPDLLPEKVPVHWNAEGKADRLVPRNDILPDFLIGPSIMAAFVLLSLLLPWLSPKQFSIDRFRSTYNFLMGLIGLLLAYLHAITLGAS